MIPDSPDVLCQHCGQVAECVSGREIYPRRADLARKKFWRCRPCDAHVGCHEGTERAYGRPSNRQLRQAKMAAHAAFDPLWKSGAMRRGQAYAWLALELGLPKSQTHIGYFDLRLCLLAIEACERWRISPSVVVPDPVRLPGAAD